MTGSQFAAVGVFLMMCAVIGFSVTETISGWFASVFALAIGLLSMFHGVIKGED